MLRKCTDDEISDEECKNVIDPFYGNFDEYVITYVMPEVIAFYIASSYYRNAMWEATFFQHYNSAKDIFNIDETLNTYSHMYQNRLENIVQIIEIQNTKSLENKQKGLLEPKEIIIDYEDTDYYDYNEDLDNKKEDDLVL